MCVFFFSLFIHSIANGYINYMRLRVRDCVWKRAREERKEGLMVATRHTCTPVYVVIYSFADSEMIVIERAK